LILLNPTEFCDYRDRQLWFVLLFEFSVSSESSRCTAHSIPELTNKILLKFSRISFSAITDFASKLYK
jgi:hypothetical protein